MITENERNGWWVASDGKLYPPELHPNYQPNPQPVPALVPTEASTRESIGNNATFKRLRYGGKCITCGAQIPKGGNGWHDPSASKVACVDCPLVGAAKQPIEPMRTNPTGGTSALAVGQSRRDPRWVTGAAGEYLMAKSLHEGLDDPAVILNDRSVPRSNANIDHVVVAPSGVWIIDSKLWKGLIRVKSAGGLLNTAQKLMIGDRDESARVEKIYSQVIPVANVLADPSIPIHPALVFVDGNWGAGVTVRAVQNRPYEMLGVLIAWPKAIIAKINESGPLSSEAVVTIARKLDAALPPAR